MIKVSWNPKPKQIREFGIAMIVGFAIIGTILLWTGHYRGATAAYLFGTISGLLGLSGNKAAIPIYLVWMSVAFVIGNIVGRMFLAIVYYGVLTPIALAMRVSGRDRLQLRRPPTNKSCWKEIAPLDEPKQYERQF